MYVKYNAYILLYRFLSGIAEPVYVRAEYQFSQKLKSGKQDGSRDNFSVRYREKK